MKSNKITFINHDGIKLAARMELPADRKADNFAIFAHCFTCTKNLSAVRNISRGMTNAGFGVLRFDFTGLGESEGDFADTNFSSNIQDLKAAARYLDENYKAPALLVGHSLGGAAVIYAAAELGSVEAVATIGAPADPVHVKKLITSNEAEIREKGYAEVSIGGRSFTVKKQFLDDLEDTEMSSVLDKLRKALLIAHSPQDKIVGVDNAAKIFKGAMHPKSFISLDGADHLLSDAADSTYAGNVIASWARRYVSFPEEKAPESNFQVIASLSGEEKFTTKVKAGKHQFVADEPEKAGGNDYGPTPYDLLASSLATCTAMTIRMYAGHKKWDVDEINVHVEHEKVHADDSEGSDSDKLPRIDRFTRIVEITGEVDDSQKERMLNIANKCPVHRTLLSEIRIETELGKE